ncbi:MAG: hypothetical protein PHY47_08895 [Lachnospiraceae bacterium]|nr:hypothetical protein [Lachnospiraceae bacterium]
MIVIIRLMVIAFAMGFLALAGETAQIEEDTDVSHYEQYMGEDAEEEYSNKWGMDESIFPSEITDEMDIKDYKMVYYNPWDAQYLSYLVVEYDDEAYQSEVSRLENYPSKKYLGYYGAEGFDESYELLAMNAHSYQGFVYALTDGEDEIIYVEVIFCNYFMDLDYEDYIDTDYLPIGFDATTDNPYRKKIMGED